MAGRILKDDIEALRERADIVAVIGAHTKLTRAGQRYKGLCPFHHEKTPSFSVDAAQGLYVCYGCHEGGDVYRFLQKLEGLSFVEAVEQLARQVGYTLRYEELSTTQQRALGERTGLLAANEAAAAFYHEQLLAPVGEPARRYLKSRGFGRGDAERFRIGFAGTDWDALVRHLKSRRFSERDIERVDLAVRNSRGGLRDRFHARVVFPILDPSSAVIGFGGRIVPGIEPDNDRAPKYLNTSETPLYHKQKVLYGLSWARPEIVRSETVLVCEGYTDVIALHKAGITNVVATCGTAVGEDHLRSLRKYARRIVLAFDSDEAGAQAAERAWRLAQDEDLELRVLVFPAGSDPADVAMSRPAEEVRALVDAAEPVLAFILRRRVGGHDVSSPEGRARAARAVAPLLAAVADPVLRNEYTRLSGEVAGVSASVVAAEVERLGVTVPAIATSAPAAAPRGGAVSARARLEREALRIALQRAELLPSLWLDVVEDDFTHPKARAVFRALQAAGGAGAAAREVVEAAEDDKVRTLVRELALEDFTTEPDKPHVAMVVGRLLLERLEATITDHKRELERLNPVSDARGYRARFEQLIELEARRRQLLDLSKG